MTKENRDKFSDALGLEPMLVDCTAFTQCRRPRLFWYEEDVQKVLLPDGALFWVEKVLKRKGNQVFVAWKGWPKQYNSWIWKKDLQVL